ncbi:MAG TPA: hypothetical protein VG942_09180 [Hyphomonadaceae bacterium]|nr:hypothetical protein [Hyphomonadaceae bacterium]
MGFWEFILGIVLISTVGGIITTAIKADKHRIRARAFDSEASELKAMVADMHGDVMKLQDRVKVLERLATDGDRNLAAEIERLSREKTSPRV